MLAKILGAVKTTPELVSVSDVEDPTLAGKDMPKSYRNFVQAMANRESSDNYAAENSLGYLGRYQFGMARLTDFGLARRKVGHSGFSNRSFEWVEGLSTETFLRSKKLQDVVFDLHVGNLRKQVLRSYSRHLGRTVLGVLVSMSGMIACMHLLGPGGLKKFLSGRDTGDANGTKASDYLTLFADYDIPGNLPNPKDVRLLKYVDSSTDVV